VQEQLAQANNKLEEKEKLLQTVSQRLSKYLLFFRRKKNHSKQKQFI
jgi:hypothetical protein